MNEQKQNLESNSENLVEIEPYLHLFVVIEHEEGTPVPVSLEMLGVSWIITIGNTPPMKKWLP